MMRSVMHSHLSDRANVEKLASAFAHLLLHMFIT